MLKLAGDRHTKGRENCTIQSISIGPVFVAQHVNVTNFINKYHISYMNAKLLSQTG